MAWSECVSDSNVAHQGFDCICVGVGKVAKDVLWAFADQRLRNDIALLKPILPSLGTFNILAIKALEF